MDREERGSHAMGQLPICSRGLVHPRRTLEPLGGRLRAPTWSGGSGTSGEVNGDPAADQQGYGRGCGSPLCQKEGWCRCLEGTNY